MTFVLFLIGCVFVPIGAACLVASRGVVEARAGAAAIPSFLPSFFPSSLLSRGGWGKAGASFGPSHLHRPPTFSAVVMRSPCAPHPACLSFPPPTRHAAASPLLSTSLQVTARYDEVCLPGVFNNVDRDVALLALNGTGTTCTVTLTPSADMSPPVFLYYELDNYFQNHRHYMTSRSDVQLAGQSIDASYLSSCSPELYQNGNSAQQITPCGLVAWSLFNDTYAVSDGSTGAAISVSESGIAWPSDKAYRFQLTSSANFNNVSALRGGGQILNGDPSQDEHLMVWMRAAAMPRFRKPWGIISTRLPANKPVVVTVANRYNTYRFSGKKSVVLSTASWIGGRNDFLGIAYLAVGGLSLFFSLVFLGLHLRPPRLLGDVSQLSWVKSAAAY